MRYKKIYHVYILANDRRTIYTGATDRLRARLETHSLGLGSRFVRDHKLHKLVYAEEYPTRMDAARREVQIKGWRRSKKIALIENLNPEWIDLSFDVG